MQFKTFSTFIVAAWLMAAVRSVDVPALTSLTSVIESITAAPSTNTPLLSYAQSAYSRVSSEVQWSQSQAAAQQSGSATTEANPSDTNGAGGASDTNGAGGAGASDTNGAGGAGATDTNAGGAGATDTAASTGGTGNENSQSVGSSTQAMLLSASVSVFLASFAAMLA